MSHARIVVIGAGITGVTTAYALLRQGYAVTVIDRNPYPSMETSYANGGQLSASNAEVWNSWGTIAKGLKWMFSAQAPLLLNPAPSFHKYSCSPSSSRAFAITSRTRIETTRLAIAARQHLFEIAEREHIDFDLEKRGILHLYHDDRSFAAAAKSNELLRQGGLERYPVTSEEIRSIEPTLAPTFHGGFFTPSDATGDIRKFTRGLAEACARQGTVFQLGSVVTASRQWLAARAHRPQRDRRRAASGQCQCRGCLCRRGQPPFRLHAGRSDQHLPGEGLLDHRMPR